VVKAQGVPGWVEEDRLVAKGPLSIMSLTNRLVLV
jgi:hypothetical protein